MYLNDLEYTLKNYRNLPHRVKNKAMRAKIKLIPSYKAFGMTMMKIGIDQTNKQYAHLILTDEKFNKHNDFKLNNTIKLNEKNIVFFDEIDRDKYNVPKGKTVNVYTRTYRQYHGNKSTRILEVAFILDDKIFVINPRDEMTIYEKERHQI